MYVGGKLRVCLISQRRYCVWVQSGASVNRRRVFVNFVPRRCQENFFLEEIINVLFDRTWGLYCDSDSWVFGLMPRVGRLVVIKWAVAARCDLRRTAIENLVKGFSKFLVRVVTYFPKYTIGGIYQRVSKTYVPSRALTERNSERMESGVCQSNFGGFCAPLWPRFS